MNKKIDIYLAGPRGFCAGVERAILMVQEAIKKYGAPVYVRHEIVHNKYVVDNLKSEGAIFIEELSEIDQIDRPVIFSAHGVPKSVPKEAEKLNLLYYDATCPLVSKIHREVENFERRDLPVILIGHRNHPEVIGTMGQLPKNSIDLIERVEDADKYVKKNDKKIAYITQTTLSVDDTKKIVEVLKNKFPEIKEPVKEDICYATTNRQAAVKKIAKECEMFFIIGSKNSSNSLRLVEVAQQAGCKQSELIHTENEIPIKKIINCSTIGISSGASAPEVLVKNFIDKIKKEVKVNIEEVEIIKENVIFKTPGKLN